ncbi:hypothetical protein M076_1144 [Bacteroides fragilis str. 2-F-2 |uniref:Uncharacterized protein n=1 Tax=Bacteroides fragilis str. 2-F-2 \|nr:hypothetical protein M076_1144 [Bacteroides fragilis str. 2-F-2 \
MKLDYLHRQQKESYHHLKKGFDMILLFDCTIQPSVFV